MDMAMDIDHSAKVNMSLDDIILHEKMKKEALRAQCSDEEDGGDSRGSSSTQIYMSPHNFPDQKKFICNKFYRKQYKHNQNNDWTDFRKTKGSNMENGRRYNSIHRRFNMKWGVGKPNSYMLWRQRSFGRNYCPRYYNSHPLSARNLAQFNRQNPNYFRRGPGSTGSGGSCAGSVCSNASFRSNTSFRSNRSIGSRRSYSIRSSNRPSHRCRFNKFVCYLNLSVQKQIRKIQKNKSLRIQNTSSENINDEPTKCRPTPSSTGISFNHIFKRFIVNPLDLDF